MRGLLHGDKIRPTSTSKSNATGKGNGRGPVFSVVVPVVRTKGPAATSFYCDLCVLLDDVFHLKNEGKPQWYTKSMALRFGGLQSATVCVMVKVIDSCRSDQPKVVRSEFIL